MTIATEVFADENRTVERDMTEAELSELAALQEELAAAKEAEKAAAEEKAAAKAVLLDRLGITAEEAALLLG